MDAQRFRALSARNRALVAVAVLLDGHEAAEYLSSDAINAGGLSRAAADIAAQEPELRMAFIGTMLRAALAEMEKITKV